MLFAFDEMEVAIIDIGKSNHDYLETQLRISEQEYISKSIGVDLKNSWYACKKYDFHKVSIWIVIISFLDFVPNAENKIELIKGLVSESVNFRRRGYKLVEELSQCFFKIDTNFQFVLPGMLCKNIKNVVIKKIQVFKNIDWQEHQKAKKMTYSIKFNVQNVRRMVYSQLGVRNTWG